MIWEPGQNWYAEVTDEDTVGLAETPPREVAQAIPGALASTTWTSCAALRRFDAADT
jgi:hypothetical protein